MVLPLQPPMMPPPQPAAMAASPMALMPPEGVLPPLPMQMQGGGMGMDMMAMLSDPEVMIALLELIEAESELQNGPRYKKWYKRDDYQKPKPDDVVNAARRDKAIHQMLIERIRIERKILNLQVVGTFDGFEPDSEVAFQDPSLVGDFNLAVNLVATCDINFDAKATRISNAEIAEKKEQFAHAFRDKWERRHTRSFGTDLKYDEVKTAMGTGHVCARLSLDFNADSDEVPINADLLDVTTCFPTWDGDRGLATMRRVYSQTVGQVVSLYGGFKKGIKKDLLEKKVTAASGEERNRNMSDQVEVIEHWDRRWYTVVIDGIEAVNAEHRFGFVPFVYLISPYGDAGITSLHALDGGAGASKSIQEEIAFKGLSHIWTMRKAHEQKEAIIGTMFTELKKTKNPAQTWEQDDHTYGDAPQTSDAEGAVNLVRAGHERRIPGVEKPGFSLIGPVMGVTNEAAMRNMMPAASYGLTSNANESGTAIDGLAEAGRDKIAPWMSMMQMFDRECAEMAMQLTADWGHLLGTDGQRGEFEIGLMDPTEGMDNIVTISHRELREAGPNIRSKRTSIKLSGLASYANTMIQLMSNNLILTEDALEMRGVQDPQAYARKLRIQELKNDPEFKKIEVMKLLEEEGDYQGAAIYREMMAAQQAPPPDQMGGPPPPGMPPGAPGGPGTMGGNPGGPSGPQMAPPMGDGGLPARLPGPPPAMTGIPG